MFRRIFVLCIYSSGYDDIISIGYWYTLLFNQLPTVINIAMQAQALYWHLNNVDEAYRLVEVLPLEIPPERIKIIENGLTANNIELFFK